jgi:prepilin-type N-terminal cleavage/methylation domain-containing protein
MTTKRTNRARGFTLIEVMLVVAMIGILCSIAGVAWMRYVKKSRTTEAVGHLQKMWAGSIAYFEADHADHNGLLLDKQFPGDCSTTQIEPDCCTGPMGRCSGNDPIYQAEPWKALAFNISDPHLYRPVARACPDPKKNLWLEAWGDLDCDGIQALFIRKADVTGNGDVQGYATPAVVNETE